jgi:hypothetical protein
VEHAHWLRDVIWKEDKSLIRTGNGPHIWSAITNLVITLFRIYGVTRFAEETRRCAQDPSPRTPFPGHPMPLTRMNATHDFDESLCDAVVVTRVRESVRTESVSGWGRRGATLVATEMRAARPTSCWSRISSLSSADLSHA